MRVLNLEKVNQKEGERQKPQCLLEPRLQGDILSLLPCTVGYTNQADGKWEGTTQRRKNPGAKICLWPEQSKKESSEVGHTAI